MVGVGGSVTFFKFVFCFSLVCLQLKLFKKSIFKYLYLIVFVHFFVDREYKCLGQWQENGFTYTFTQRKHVGTYECFVGAPLSENEFMIREAGRHCDRSMDALGMVLTKKSKFEPV